MEQVFTRNLVRALSQRIKGCIKAHVVNDILVVDILDRDDTAWHYTVPDIALPLSLGLTSKTMADLVTKEYRKFILHRYFR